MRPPHAADYSRELRVWQSAPLAASGMRGRAPMDQQSRIGTAQAGVWRVNPAFGAARPWAHNPRSGMFTLPRRMQLHSSWLTRARQVSPGTPTVDEHPQRRHDGV